MRSCRDCLQLRKESVQAYNDMKEKLIDALDRINKLEAHVRALNASNAQNTTPRRLNELETKVRQIERDLP